MNSFISIFSHPDRFVRLTIAAVLVCTAVHIAFFEAFASIYLKPNDPIEFQKSYLQNHAGEVRILGLGDSHTQMGLNLPHPAYFNYSICSDSIVIQYFKLKNLLPRASSLQVLLLQADCHQFSRLMTTFDYTPYADLTDEPVDATLGPYPSHGRKCWQLFSLRDRIAPALYWNLFHVLFYPPSLLGEDVVLPNGTKSPITRWTLLPPEERVRQAQEQANRVFYHGDMVLEPFTEYYRKILRMARDRGIRVVLIRYPLPLEYARLLNDETGPFYRGVQDEFSVPLLDYTHLFDSRQDLFSDTNHLNIHGANALGRRVLGDLAGILPAGLLAVSKPRA